MLVTLLLIIIEDKISTENDEGKPIIGQAIELHIIIIIIMNVLVHVKSYDILL